MNGKVGKKVYAANGKLEAIAVQSILEQAGVPVQVLPNKTGGYLDVVVPNEWAYDARQILTPENQCGEKLLVQA